MKGYLGLPKNSIPWKTFGTPSQHHSQAEGVTDNL